MIFRTTHCALGAAALALSLGAFSGAPAMALTQKECGVKYQEAKTAGTLNGLNYNAFRKAQCGSDATAAPAAAPSAPVAQPAAAPANPLRPTPAAVAPKPAPQAAPAAPAAAGAAVFPKAIDPKYSTLSPGKQRFKTCDDQYQANKATNSNGGMKWIEKGGGYYSACNKALKG